MVDADMLSRFNDPFYGQMADAPRAFSDPRPSEEELGLVPAPRFIEIDNLGCSWLGLSPKP